MKNVMTIDVEDWYQSNDFNFSPECWDNFESRVEDNTRKILEMLDKYETKATFFVLGSVAKQHPKLVRECVEKGHEIGSHGMWHKMVNRLSREEFIRDLRESREIIEQIAGKKVVYYRAASWSISRKILWMLEVLEEEGFLCDSSVQPFRTPLSGMNGAPYFPFHPVINSRTLRLVEFPSTVLRVGRLNLPFAGGLYLRSLPGGLIKRALRRVNKERPGMVYIHPWEADTKQPRLRVPPHIAFAHYSNLSTTLEKLEMLLQEFEFAPLGEIISSVECPEHVV